MRSPVTVSDDGANNRTIVDLSGVVAASQIIFGSGFTNITTTKVWLQPGNGPDAPLITDTHRVIAPRSGTLRNMYVKHNVPGPDATNLTYTVEINGAGTLLAVTLAASAASGSNLVNSAAVLQGQEIAVSLTKAAGLTQEVLRPVISMEYA
jgi:hypothetical protein